MTQDDPQPAQAAVLLDMDGVLCENTLRREYGNDRDYELFGRRCGNAAPFMEYLALVQALQQNRVAVFILTARSEKLRAITGKWLKHYNIKVDELFMRPLKNNDQDPVLKQKMLTVLSRKYRFNQPNGLVPILAVDDNEQVVKMYHDAGLPACQPGHVPEVLL